MGIALISTYPPRMCGLATVASHLRTALLAAGEPYVPVVALVKDPSDGAFGPEVLAPIRHHQIQDYVTAAHALNSAPVDAVILQHEFGIFGGQLGSHVHPLLASLHKPVITVFHTVLEEAPRAMVAVLREVAARSSGIVTLSHRDRGLLCSVYGLPADRVAMIPLGVPKAPAGTSEEWKARLALSGRTVAMTFGLLGAGKGLETAIEAVGRVAPSHPELLYLIVGTTHPEERRAGGEAYRARLVARTHQLGLVNQIQFIDRYLEEEELLQYLLACDIYITPYPQKGRGVSLTTLYAANLGKAILTTPFDHARELLDNGAGWMVPFHNAHAMAQALEVLVSKPEARADLGAAAQARTRDFTWSSAAHRYLALARALGAGVPAPGKGDPEPHPALNGEIHADSPTISVRFRREASLRLVLYNTGTAAWSPQEQEIAVVGDLISPSRKLLKREIWRHPVTAPVPSGGTGELEIHFAAPSLPGSYLLEIYPVHGQAGRFGQPLFIQLVVTL